MEIVRYDDDALKTKDRFRPGHRVEGTDPAVIGEKV